MNRYIVVMLDRLTGHSATYFRSFADRRPAERVKERLDQHSGTMSWVVRLAAGEGTSMTCAFCGASGGKHTKYCDELKRQYEERAKR